jgi:hypothetical protein
MAAASRQEDATDPGVDAVEGKAYLILIPDQVCVMTHGSKLQAHVPPASSHKRSVTSRLVTVFCHPKQLL